MSAAGPFRLVVLAGLPGTGKSTLARALAAALDAPVLDKDRVRAALFEPRDVAYEPEQDDLVVAALLAAARDLARRGRRRRAILDGRTWTRRSAVEALVRFAAEAGLELRWIECVAPPELARARLEADRRAGVHPAADRGPELHERLAAAAEPLVVERLVLDTGTLAQDELLGRALAFASGS